MSENNNPTHLEDALLGRVTSAKKARLLLDFLQCLTSIVGNQYASILEEGGDFEEDDICF